ncbi:MAG: hypothetical protein GWP59_02605, partial [Chlamydiales bacterium]|nr:hypothetical protein [Chlamydiales bacterium]
MLAASFNGLNFKVYLQPSGFEYTESMASLYSEFKRAGSRSLQLASHISDFLNRVLAINEANHLTIDYIAICRSIKHVFSIKDPESGNCLNHLLARLALINHALFTSDSSVLKDASMPFLEFNLNRVPLPRSSRVLSKQEIDHWFKKPSEKLCFCLKELSTMGVRDESLHLLREALVLHQSEFASVNYFPFLGFRALYGLAENQESTLEDFFKAFKTSLEEFALLEDVMGVSAIPLYRAMLVPVLSFFSPFAGTVAPRLYFLNLSFSEGAFFRHKPYKDSLIAWSEVVLAKESCDSRSFFEKLYTTSEAGLALRMRFYSSCLSKEFHHLALTNMLSLKQELNTKRKGLAMLTESERLLLKETFQEMFARGFSTIDKGRFQEYLSALCYFLPALEFERETLLDFYKYLEAYQPPGSLALENFMELKLKVAQKLFRLTKTPSRLELISLVSKSKDEQIKAIAKEKLMLEDPENFATDQLLLLEQLYKDLKIDEERAFSIVYALCMKSLGKADKLDRATEALCTNMIEELVHKGNLGKALELSSAYVQKQAPISEELFYLLFDAAVVKRDLSPQELESLLSIFECVHESNPSLSRKESIKDTIFELWFESSLNTKSATFVMALLSESLSSSKDDTKSLFYLNCLLLVKAEMIEANLAVIYSYLTLLERSFLSSTKELPKVPLKRALLQVYLRHETSVFLHLEKKEVAKLLKQMMGICFELGESGDIEYFKGKYVTEFLEYVAENSEANLDDQLDHFNYLASSMSSSVESLASYLSKLALLMPDSTERASLPSKFWDEVSIYFIESTPLFHSHLELIDQLSICFWPFSNRVKTSRGVDFLSQHLMPYPDYIARLVEVDNSQALASLDTLAPWFFQLEFSDEMHRKEQFHLLFEWLKTKKEEGAGLLLFKELAFQRFIKDHQLITTQEQLSFVFDELQQVFTTTSEEDLFRVANTFKELLNSENVVAVLNQKSGEAEKLNGQLAKLVSLNYQLFYDYRSTNLKNGEEAALSYINILFSELNFFVSLSFQLDRRKLLQNSSREFFSSIFIYVKELESKQDFPFSTASPSSVIRDALSRVSENESMSMFYFNKNSFSLLKQGACFFCTMDSLDHQGYKIFSLHLATLLKDKKEFHASITLYLKRVSNYLSLTLTNEWSEVLNTSFQSEISDLKGLLNGKLAFRLSESCLSKFMYALQDCSLTLAPENQGVLTPAFDLCFNVLKPSLVDCLKNSADHEFNHMSFSLASRSFLEHGCCSLSFCNQLLALQHDSTTLLDQSLDLFEQAIERADNLDRKAKVLIEELSFLPSLLIQDKERYLEEAVRIEDIIVLLLNLYEDPEASEELKNSLAVAWGDYYSVLIESWGVAEAFSCSTITLGEYESVINELTQLISIERRYEKIKQKESCIVTTFLQEVIKFSNDDEGAIEALLLLYNFFDLDLSVGFRKALVDMVHSYFSHEGNTLEHIEEISLCHSTGEEPAGINHNGVCVISALKFLVDSSVSASLDKEAFKEAALLYFNKMKPSSIWSNAAVFEIELEFRMSLAKAAIAFQDDLKDFVTQDDGELRYFIHIFYEQAIVYFDLKTTVDNEAARALTEDEKLFLRELIITVGKEELINYSLSANKLLFTRALASYADFGVFSAEDYIVIANTILREKGPGGVILVVEGLHQLIPSEVICCKVLAEEYDCSLFILLDSVFATVRNRLVNDKLSDEEAKKASELLTLAPIRYYLAALIRKKTDNIFALNLEYIISYLFFFYLIPKPVEADLLLAKLIKSQIYLPTRVQAPEGREMSLQALGGEIFADKCSDKGTPYKKSQRLVSAMSGNKPSLLGEMIEVIRLAGGECKKEVEKKSESVARERLSPDPDKESQESVSVQAIPEALLKIERPVELILWCELAFLWISAAAESTLCFEEYAVLSQLGGL